MRRLAVVDDEEMVIYVENDNGLIEKFHIDMYVAALRNPKYWDDAFVEVVSETKIPDLVLNQ